MTRKNPLCTGKEILELQLLSLLVDLVNINNTFFWSIKRLCEKCQTQFPRAQVDIITLLISPHQ